MNDIDKTLQDIIKNDELHFDIDPASIHRLKNHMRITSLRSNVRMNSILPILSFQNIRPLSGLKAGFVCLIILAFFGYQRISTNSHPILNSDSNSVIQIADTNTTFLHNDSIYTNL